jgi:hypothetical protein
MADLTAMMQAAAGAGAAGEPILPQEVFSATLYTGNGSTQTITNGIDLDGEGGLVWTKDRTNGLSHALYDTARGGGSELSTNTTGAASSESGVAFLSTGYSFGARSLLNFNGGAYVSWTFRKAPKFFDIVTYTGDGVAGRTVAHNLGSVPGVMIVKCTSATESWRVYHRSLGASENLKLDSTEAAQTNEEPWNFTAPTATEFTLAQYNSSNGSGKTYVAYLFAHDAGGFGTSSENGISCGSYTGNGSATGPTVTLGYEPQWLMIKRADSTGDWIILDSKRDVSNPRDKFLEPNTSDAEATGNDVDFNATSFQLKTTSATVNASGGTYIYVAIRADM